MYLQTWPDMVRTVTGVWAQYSNLLSEKVVLNAGGRVDFDIDFLQSGLAREQFAIFNYDLSDRYYRFTKSLNLSVQYNVSRPVELDAEAGYSERFPTITELYGFYLYNAYDGYDYIGNPGIKTERSLFGRIGIQFSKPWFKANLSQPLNLVRNYIMGVNNSEIPPMNFYTNGTRVYTNVPGAILYNLNLQAQIVPLEGLSVFILSKYTWGQLETGAPLPLIPPFNNVISVNYQLGRWIIQAENETAAAQNRINVAYGEIPSPAYTVFNLKSSYHFMFLHPVMFDLSLGITNIFNAKYYEHLDWGQLYRPGRSFDINLKFSF
jgi:iron complex outermembrane recepter protein